MWEGCCKAKDQGKVKSIGVRCVFLFFAALLPLFLLSPFILELTFLLV
jgi:hypothetical protein